MAAAQTSALPRTAVNRPATARASGPNAGTLPLPVIESAAGAPPLPRRISPLARRLQQVCAAMLADALAGEDLVQLEYGSLVCLDIEPGIDQRRLAEAMGIDPSNASLIVERLHSMGLIERRVSEVDRRARELYLTPKGRKLWRRINPKTSAANEAVLAPLAPAERERFLDMLIRVIEGNRSHARPGAGRRKRNSPQLLENNSGHK